MLASLDSQEIAEWMAYEQVAGPMDGQWRDEMLSQLHELMQFNNRLAGSQHKKNPAPEVKPPIRPWELYTKERK